MKPETAIKLSIITVVKDDYVGLLETLESVVTQKEALTRVEHLVIDAGMKAKLRPEISQLFKKNRHIVYQAEPDDGIYFGMNKGIKKARGEWVLFLNTQDILFSTKTLSQFLVWLDTQKNEVDVVVAPHAELWHGQVVIKNTKPIKLMPRYMPTSHQSMCVQKKVCEQHLFDTSYKVCADTQQFASILCSGGRVKTYKKCISCVMAQGFATDNFSLMIKERKMIRKKYYPGFIQAVKMELFIIKGYTKRVVRKVIPKNIIKTLRSIKYKL